MKDHYILKIQNYLTAIVMLLYITVGYAQTVVIYPAGNVPTAADERGPLGVFCGYERSQFIYTAAELGITPGSVITEIAFWLHTVNIPPGLDYDYKIYLRETTSEICTASPFSQLSIASTLVYSSPPMTANQLDSGGTWINSTLASTMATTGSNLEFLVETNWASSTSTGSDPDGWHNNQTPPLTGNGFPYLGNQNSIMFYQNAKIACGQRWRLCDSPALGHGEVVCYRPNVRVTYVSPNPCTVAPAGVTAVASVNPACGTPFNLSLTGLPPQSGLIFQWFANGSPIPGATAPTFRLKQTIPLLYYCSIWCVSNGSNNISSSIMVGQMPVDSCYCASGPNFSGTSAIGNVTFATLNHPPGGCTPATGNPIAAGGYTDYTALVASPTLMQGQTYSFTSCQIEGGSFSGPQYFNAFIDYNIDGEFDEVTERVFSAGNTSAINQTVSDSITIPYATGLGTTRMRVIMTAGANAASPPCGTYNSGETEDYNVKIVPGVPCTNPVVAGTAVSSHNDVCCPKEFTLSITGSVTTGGGLYYQWQSAASCSGPFNNIPGATGTTHTTTQTGTTFYQCIVTCQGGASSTTTCVQVNSLPVSLCYCSSNLHSVDCTTAYISNVSLHSLIDTTDCSAGNPLAYTFYPATGNTTTALAQNVTYNLTVTTAGTSAQTVSAWIDWDANGVFDSLEWIGLTGTMPVTQPSGAFTMPVNVPATAVTGLTGMRIRSCGTVDNSANNACTLFGSGETEDYLITITTPMGINEAIGNVEQSMLLQPNPAVSRVTVNYTLARNCNAELRIMDLTGKEVMNRKLTNMTKGNNSTVLDVSRMMQGFYIVRLITPDAITVKHLEIIH